MPRLEIELTSRRDDGTWTWRAAGARQPKGTVSDELVPPGATTGEVVRADTEVDIDGITVVGITPIAAEDSSEGDTIEVIGSGRDQPGVVTNFAPKPERGKGRGGGRRERRRPGREPRGEGGRGRTGPRRDGPTQAPAPDRGGRAPSERGARGPGKSPRRAPKQRTGPPPVPKRPKPKRLKPERAHRDKLIRSLPAEHQPIAEKLAAGGMAAVRKAISEQNSAARAEGRPEVPAEPLLAMAEELHPRLRTAEWLDRAEAAVVDLDEISLRDLRTVVTAANDAARDANAQALAESLREGLNRRVQEAHRQWVDDVTWALEAGRVVRALRLSSRPPDRKQSLPEELVGKLTVAAGEALNSETGPDRWAVILEAVSFSPVRRDVVPAGPPNSPSTELLEAVAKAAQRTPQIASLFGIDVKAPPGTPARAPSPPPLPPVDTITEKPPAAAPAPTPAEAEDPKPAEVATSPTAPVPSPAPPSSPPDPEPAAAPPPAPSVASEHERERRAKAFGAPRVHDTPGEKVAEAALQPEEETDATETDGS